MHPIPLVSRPFTELAAASSGEVLGHCLRAIPAILAGKGEDTFYGFALGLRPRALPLRRFALGGSGGGGGRFIPTGCGKTELEMVMVRSFLSGVLRRRGLMHPIPLPPFPFEGKGGRLFFGYALACGSRLPLGRFALGAPDGGGGRIMPTGWGKIELEMVMVRSFLSGVLRRRRLMRPIPLDPGPPRS